MITAVRLGISIESIRWYNIKSISEVCSYHLAINEMR